MSFNMFKSFHHFYRHELLIRESYCSHSISNWVIIIPQGRKTSKMTDRVDFDCRQIGLTRNIVSWKILKHYNRKCVALNGRVEIEKKSFVKYDLIIVVNAKNLLKPFDSFVKFKNSLTFRLFPEIKNWLIILFWFPYIKNWSTFGLIPKIKNCFNISIDSYKVQ